MKRNSLTLTLSLLLTLLVSLASAATPATQATSQPATQTALRDGPWAATLFGGSGRYVTPCYIVRPWWSIADVVNDIEAYAKTQGGKPVVVTFVDPYQSVRSGGWPVAYFADGWKAGWAKLAADRVRIDLVVTDAEPYDKALDATFIAFYRQHYSAWGNAFSTVVPASATDHLMRFWGWPGAAEDVQVTSGQTVNIPGCYDTMGDARTVATTRIDRIGQLDNRVQAAILGDPQTPAVPYVGGVEMADGGITRDELRDVYASLCPLTGGRFLIFDESTAAMPTSGADATADVDAMLVQWAGTIGNRKVAKAANVDHWHAVNDAYVTTWCKFTSGEFAEVTISRDAWTKPLQLATPDGRVVTAPPPADGSHRAMAVFPGGK